MAFGFGMSLPVAISTALGNQNRYAAIINDAGELAPYVTFTRSSTATRYNSAGLLETVAIGIPRYDYDPTTVTRANLALNSSALHTYVTLASPVVTPNAATAPDGTMTATQFEVSSGQTSFALRNVGPSSLVGNNANSIYFKLVGATTGQLAVIRADRAAEYCGVNVATRAPLTLNGSGISNSSVTIETLPDGWYRLKGAYTSDAAIETRIQFIGSVAGTKILLWGVQAEQGTLTVTDYIPTGVVERGGELVVNGDFSNGTTGWSFLNDNGTVTTQTVTNGVLTYGNLGPSVWPKILNNGVKARPGAQYLVTMTVTAITSADGNPLTTAFVSLGDVAGRASRNITAPGTYQFFVINSSALTSGLEIIFSHGDLTSISISEISVKEINSDYNSPRGNATLRGLLIEEQRTNLLLRSEDLTAAAWSAVELGAITANATVAPDGALTADKITETVNNSGHYIAQAATTTAAVHTLTIYAKASERSFVGLFHVESSTGMSFNLSSGTVGSLIIGAPVSQKITSVGNGWQRCEISVNATAGNNNFRIFIMTDATTYGYVGTVGSGIFLWGAQLEAGAFATSYIPTTTAAVTRAADSAVISNLADIGFNAAEGSVYVEGITKPGLSGNSTLFSIDGGSYEESIYNFVANATGGMQYRVYDGAVSQVNIGLSAITPNQSVKVSQAYKLNDFAACFNGGSALTDTAGTLPTVNTFRIGRNNTTEFWGGHIRRLRYYNRRLSNAQLQALTAP